jgi:hypothetical protein
MENNRRKLVLGSAAVPLVLTVRPAGAHAKKSIACIADGKMKDKPHEILKTHDDEYMRKWIDVYALEVYDDKDKKWKKLKDKKFICGVDGHTYWELDKRDPYSAEARKTDMKRGPGIKEVKLEKKRALTFYRYDDGHETGYAWEPKGGKHSTKSCWNSIKPKYT